MNDLERYLDSICRGIAGPRALRRHVRDELRGHLEEAAERHRAGGLGRDDALRRAMEEFGDAGDVGEELQAVHGRRLTAFLVEKATEWKERAMRTEYRWSVLAAGSALATCVLAALTVVGAELFILPRMELLYSEVEEPLPPLAVQTWRCLIVATEYWFLWLFPLLLGAVAFEWRCRGEHKPLIRGAAGAVIGLGAMVVMVAVSIATVIPLALLPTYASAQHIGPTVFARADEARAEFVELTRAVEDTDGAAAEDAWRRLRDALESLDRLGGHSGLLAVGSRREELHRIPRLVDEASDMVDEIYESVRQGQRPDLEPKLSALRDAFDQFAAGDAAPPEEAPAGSNRPAPRR